MNTVELKQQQLQCLLHVGFKTEYMQVIIKLLEIQLLIQVLDGCDWIISEMVF